LTEQLTRYDSATLKEVAYLSFSFILVLFSASLMGFCDRLILARYSIEGLEAAITALWLSQLFQIPFIRAASMTQIFVGQYKGAGQLKKIGPCVWQMIWFSLSTLLITWPLSQPIGNFFFRSLHLQAGERCFHYLMGASFLFPLGTTLSAFYLGQGRTKHIIKISLISHALHIALDFPLVFGISLILPPLGALGSIIASLAAQSFFCGWLLIDFLRLKNRIAYATHHLLLHWASLWKYLQLSFPRAAARIVQLTAWIFITRIMLAQGQHYPAVLAFGGSLQMFLSCFNEGMSQALSTIASYRIGSGQFQTWKVVRSGCLFLAIESTLLAIPLLLFSKTIIALFFKEALTPTLSTFLTHSCQWIWLGFFSEGLNHIGFALLSAYRKTLFLMACSLSAWLFGALPCYLYLPSTTPPTLWFIIAIAALFTATIYFLRLNRIKELREVLTEERAE
jgi:MATE family multidrug resistance protein